MYSKSKPKTFMSRYAYSKQSVVYLDIGEEYSFKMNDGALRNVRLIKVDEHRDSVIGLIRRAEVRVLIDDEPLELICMPYVMPTEYKGIRIQADTTSGWLPHIPKRVQFSIWDAIDPIVDPSKFSFHLDSYLLFSQSIQNFNEPVYQGDGDDDPAHDNSFYHNYGFDLGGCEARTDVLSVCCGTVYTMPDAPGPGDPSSVVIKADDGLYWEYAHFDSIMPDIRPGARVQQGQKIGLLGKKGYSGNWSHIHLGAYADNEIETWTANLAMNLYPWVVSAYQAQHKKNLYAVAGPHQILYAGESVVFDGSNSLAFDSEIVTYKWVFDDGQVIDGVTAQRKFDIPGVYSAELWIEDDKGDSDVGFCQVKVFSRDNEALAHIVLNYSPSDRVLTDQPICFKGWKQLSDDTGPIAIDFGDGRVIENYVDYTEVFHAYVNPGIYVVTASCKLRDVYRISEKVKVVVHPA